MQALARNGYTSSQVDKALHSGVRELRFKYYLLDYLNNFKAQLSNIQACGVANDSSAQIKRTAKLTLTDDGSINFLSDRIQPWIRLRMQDGGFAEWPQGVFVLTTPPQKATSTGTINRDVDAYDLLQVLVDDKVTDRYTVPAGTNYITAVQTLLTSAAITTTNLTTATQTLPIALDWAPGTSKLNIINNLLGSINYRSLWFDEFGVAVAIPYVSPSFRASEYTYINDSLSVMYPEAERSLDLFGVPNKWVLVVSQPDRVPLTSVYTNTNSASPTSTVNRGRTIVDFRNNLNASDQASLDAQAQRLAFEASQVYEEVDFDTAIMPMYSDSDVLTFSHSLFKVSDNYSEMSWSMDLVAGGKMKHTVRRVVSV